MKDDEKELIDSIKTKILALRVDTLDKQIEKISDKVEITNQTLNIITGQLVILNEERASRKDKLKHIVYPILVAIIINIPAILRLFMK